MKWPWQKVINEPERGTLTLLPENRIVLGFPKEHRLSEQAADTVRRQLEAWTNDPSRALIFPFPVDVDDRR